MFFFMTFGPKPNRSKFLNLSFCVMIFILSFIDQLVAAVLTVLHRAFDLYAAGLAEFGLCLIGSTFHALQYLRIKNRIDDPVAAPPA